MKKMERRKFLKLAGTAALAASLNSVLAGCGGGAGTPAPSDHQRRRRNPEAVRRHRRTRHQVLRKHRPGTFRQRLSGKSLTIGTEQLC